MLSLIFLLIFGAGFAFLSLQNTTPVSVSFLNYTFFDLPLFYVIIGSMLLGIVFAYAIYLIRYITTSFTLRSKDKMIKEEQEQLAELTKKVHQLELENLRLKKEHEPNNIDGKSL